MRGVQKMRKWSWLTPTWVGDRRVAILAFSLRQGANAQSGPQMLDPSLDVRTVVSGLTMPIGVAFLGPNDMLVLEKDTGPIKRVVNGVVTATVLDLGVNRNSERGLLSIALHPDFPRESWRLSLLDLPQHCATAGSRSFPTSAASTRTCSCPTAGRFGGAAARQSRRSLRLERQRR